MASTTKEIAMDWSPVLLVYTDGSVERFKDSPLICPRHCLIRPPVSPARTSPSPPTSPPDSSCQIIPLLPTTTAECSPSWSTSTAAASPSSPPSPPSTTATSPPWPPKSESWQFQSSTGWPRKTLCRLLMKTPGPLSSGSVPTQPEISTLIGKSHGDFDRLFVGGSASGGNIAHNLAMRAGWEPLLGNVKILGAFLLQPLFWGTKPIRAEPKTRDPKNIFYKLWMQVFASLPGGPDNPMVNPFAAEAAILAGLGCSRLLVVVAEKDISRDRGLHYCDAVAESGWPGKLEVHQIEGGWHLFDVKDPDTNMAKKMMNTLASFLGRH